MNTLPGDGRSRAHTIRAAELRALIVCLAVGVAAIGIFQIEPAFTPRWAWLTAWAVVALAVQGWAVLRFVAAHRTLVVR